MYTVILLFFGPGWCNLLSNVPFQVVIDWPILSHHDCESHDHIHDFAGVWAVNLSYTLLPVYILYSSVERFWKDFAYAILLK